MRTCRAFSLLELLIALLVIAVLVTIAFPGVLSVRKRAFDAAALNQLREAVTHQFAYAVERGSYTDDPAELLAQGLRVVPGVTLELRAGGASFCMFARHRRGSYWFAATPEKLVRTSVPASRPAPASCP